MSYWNSVGKIEGYLLGESLGAEVITERGYYDGSSYGKVISPVGTTVGNGDVKLEVYPLVE